MGACSGEHSVERARHRVVGRDVEFGALVSHREVGDETARLLGGLALAESAAFRRGVDGDEHRGPVVRIDGRYADGPAVERGVGVLFARGEESVAIKVEDRHRPTRVPIGRMALFRSGEQRIAQDPFPVLRCLDVSFALGALLGRRGGLARARGHRVGVGVSLGLVIHRRRPHR